MVKNALKLHTANLCNSSNTNYHVDNCNMRYQLAKVDSITDLAVRFDSKLAFLDHMSEKINKAFRILGNLCIERCEN